MEEKGTNPFSLSIGAVSGASDDSKGESEEGVFSGITWSVLNKEPSDGAPSKVSNPFTQVPVACLDNQESSNPSLFRFSSIANHSGSGLSTVPDADISASEFLLPKFNNTTPVSLTAARANRKVDSVESVGFVTEVLPPPDQQTGFASYQSDIDPSVFAGENMWDLIRNNSVISHYLKDRFVVSCLNSLNTMATSENLKRYWHRMEIRMIYGALLHERQKKADNRSNGGRANKTTNRRNKNHSNDSVSGRRSYADAANGTTYSSFGETSTTGQQQKRNENDDHYKNNNNGGRHHHLNARNAKGRPFGNQSNRRDNTGGFAESQGQSNRRNDTKSSDYQYRSYQRCYPFNICDYNDDDQDSSNYDNNQHSRGPNTDANHGTIRPIRSIEEVYGGYRNSRTSNSGNGNISGFYPNALGNVPPPRAPFSRYDINNNNVNTSNNSNNNTLSEALSSSSGASRSILDIITVPTFGDTNRMARLPRRSRFNRQAYINVNPPVPQPRVEETSVENPLLANAIPSHLQIALSLESGDESNRSTSLSAKSFFLHSALKKNDVSTALEIIRNLSIEEVDPMINDYMNGNPNILQTAVELELVEIVEEILKHPNIDIYKSNTREPRNPLEIAIEKGNEEIANMLISYADSRPNSNTDIPSVANSAGYVLGSSILEFSDEESQEDKVIRFSSDGAPETKPVRQPANVVPSTNKFENLTPAEATALLMEKMEEIEKLQRTIVDLEEKSLCIICFENEIDTVFVGCGHNIGCMNCIKQLAKCPVCNDSSRLVIRTFRS